MMNKMIFSLILIWYLSGSSIFAQKDILKTIELPKDTSDFNVIRHLPPLNQDTTSTCWSFATLSFIESEMMRLNKQPVKLAVMFPVYYAFIEKAKYFVQTKGESHFAPGDLFKTVLNVIQEHGIVPQEVYRGSSDKQSTYNHTILYKELKDFMTLVKHNEYWESADVISKVKHILDTHLGPPPDKFIYRGVEYSPISFREKYVDLPWSQYVTLTSFDYAPYNGFTILDVPDNWRRDSTYFNLPLTQFTKALELAIAAGYTVAIDSDISEPGRIGKADICAIPEYDIPVSAISQSAREYRFNTGATTDDHLMHIIGKFNNSGGTWYLVKDSWRDAWEGRFKGYFFFHEAYVQLKVLAFLVHRDAVAAQMAEVTEP